MLIETVQRLIEELLLEEPEKIIGYENIIDAIVEYFKTNNIDELMSGPYMINIDKCTDKKDVKANYIKSPITIKKDIGNIVKILESISDKNYAMWNRNNKNFIKRYSSDKTFDELNKYIDNIINKQYNEIKQFFKNLENNEEINEKKIGEFESKNIDKFLIKQNIEKLKEYRKLVGKHGPGPIRGILSDIEKRIKKKEAGIAKQHRINDELYYPKENPAVDVIVIKGDKILLIQKEGKWALPGGFIESKSEIGETHQADETEEEAARRELKEETGIDVNEENLIEVKKREDKERDDRSNDAAWVSTTIFKTELPEDDTQEPKGEDGADSAEWVSKDEIEEKEFLHDHKNIIDEHWEKGIEDVEDVEKDDIWTLEDEEDKPEVTIDKPEETPKKSKEKEIPYVKLILRTENNEVLLIRQKGGLHLPGQDAIRPQKNYSYKETARHILVSSILNLEGVELQSLYTKPEPPVFGARVNANNAKEHLISTDIDDNSIVSEDKKLIDEHYSQIGDIEISKKKNYKKVANTKLYKIRAKTALDKIKDPDKDTKEILRSRYEEELGEEIDPEVEEKEISFLSRVERNSDKTETTEKEIKNRIENITELFGELRDSNEEFTEEEFEKLYDICINGPDDVVTKLISQHELDNLGSGFDINTNKIKKEVLKNPSKNTENIKNELESLTRYYYIYIITQIKNGKKQILIKKRNEGDDKYTHSLPSIKVEPKDGKFPSSKDTLRSKLGIAEEIEDEFFEEIEWRKNEKIEWPKQESPKKVQKRVEKEIQETTPKDMESVKSSTYFLQIPNEKFDKVFERIEETEIRQDNLIWVDLDAKEKLKMLDKESIKIINEAFPLEVISDEEVVDDEVELIDDEEVVDDEVELIDDEEVVDDEEVDESKVLETINDLGHDIYKSGLDELNKTINNYFERVKIPKSHLSDIQKNISGAIRRRLEKNIGKEEWTTDFKTILRWWIGLNPGKDFSEKIGWKLLDRLSRKMAELILLKYKEGVEDGGK